MNDHDKDLFRNKVIYSSLSGGYLNNLLSFSLLKTSFGN